MQRHSFCCRTSSAGLISVHIFLSALSHFVPAAHAANKPATVRHCGCVKAIDYAYGSKTFNLCKEDKMKEKGSIVVTLGKFSVFPKTSNVFLRLVKVAHTEISISKMARKCSAQFSQGILLG